nr:hypothetical protein OG284_27005 [Streptomyces sp. NBC_01177]
MERSNVGAATHPQVFLRVKGILKDAHRRGINGLDPLLDVSPPEYRPGPTVIPTKEQVGLLRAARDDDSFRPSSTSWPAWACATARPSPST